ncbi:DUF952 domain-containing protein [Celeribacter marinus]|uniref:Uncharacterized protein n=1 Tax=Celeribacter marinus TaxID=1397108 RepID=A0A0P0A7I1_9RHOB|nr:DUF952 domain-containing protein [Celeribacter marinus]ALI56720.1 hypothetical protein IMCC12053_2773 [Celeribacter marinus]SFK63958.1 Uncharacterized conserved protein, DUF952 family [Celeribacter marinus]
MMIYKIFRADEWAELQAKGETKGAPVDIADGYVHFSTADQARETASKWFACVDGLVLLACDVDAMSADITWEPSRGGALFPHLYRNLRLSDVVWDKPLPLAPKDAPDSHVFPKDMV